MLKEFGLATRAVALMAAVTIASPASAGIAMIDQVGAGNVSDASMSQAASGAWTAMTSDLASEVQALTALEAGAASAPVDRGARSLIEQDGIGLYAEVRQTVPDVQSIILQSGSGNTAQVYQTVNASSVSTIIQSGSGNLAIVRQ
ncbi:hypothetical protein [Phenylobacterium sp.]|uniref:hypothetical protein n=1 Tax=Phenylobacterium sp. TaxID=1871053 RepID=UPI0030F470FF